jgi:hypothetical protein
VGCASDDASSGNDAGRKPPEWPHLACDPLVPGYCAFPFPSNVYTVADETSPTGRRVAFSPETLPVAVQGAVTKADPWNKSDGFSPGSVLLAQFPDATLDGVASPLDLPRSLAEDSPTVLIDAETGERVPHFGELDRSGSEDSERSFMIRPVVRLRDATRYIVALRRLVSAAGEIAPSPAFRALRDGESFDDPSIEARRTLYADIFARLEQAGVERSDLQLAWDFTTASRDNNTGWLVHMRDEALEIAGPKGPSYVIESVESSTDATAIDPQNIAFRIHGRMTVPLYLSDPMPGGHLLFGPDGLPEPNPAQPSYEVPFEVLIPQSAKTAPAALIEYGHGLLGERTQIESGHFRSFMNEYNYVFFGLDLSGMANDDLLHIAGTLGSGSLDQLSTMFDRLHQGMLNYLVAMRMMSKGFAEDPTYGQYIDPNERYYHGISQGGIFGGVYMALSQDVTRGVLGVMGQPYLLLLNRSVDFDPFFDLLRGAYPGARDQQLGLSLVQMLWDRVEPNGYTSYIRENLLPNTPAHEVLMRAAVGDHQVSTLGAHIMARAVGAKHLESGVRDVFGLQKVTSADSGSTYVEYDFGLPPEPLCNVPLRACDDPHGKVRSLDAARQQMNEFLRTGKSTNYCTDGICRFPELSGCAPGETTPPCE